MILSAREKRVLDFILSCEWPPTVGEVCLTCHTTVKTLLGKTWPSLRAKVKALVGEL